MDYPEDLMINQSSEYDNEKRIDGQYNCINSNSEVIENEKTMKNEHYKMITLQGQQQKSAHSFCGENSQNHPPLNQEEILTIREKGINLAIKFIDQSNLNNLEASEIAISILSFLIPYTAPNFKNYSNFIIAFAINQAFYPKANEMKPSQILHQMEIDFNEKSNCFRCLKNYLELGPSFRLNEPNIHKFDSLHCYLSSLVKNELEKQLTLENTTFAHILKIIEKIEELTDNDFILIKSYIEFYWIHEDLFLRYPSIMMANAILKVLQFSEEVEFDFSPFGNVALLEQIYSPSFVKKYKQCCIDIFQISETDIPEELLSEFRIGQFQQSIENNIDQMQIEDDEIDFCSTYQISEEPFNEEFQIQINTNSVQQTNNNISNSNSNKCSKITNNNNKILYPNFNLNKNHDQENSLSYITNQFLNNQESDFIITNTPEKKHNSKIQQNSSFLLTDSLGKQHNNSLMHTQETNSSSISNFSMNTDEPKISNLKAQALKPSPSPFNSRSLSVFQYCTTQLNN